MVRCKLRSPVCANYRGGARQERSRGLHCSATLVETHSAWSQNRKIVAKENLEETLNTFYPSMRLTGHCYFPPGSTENACKCRFLDDSDIYVERCPPYTQANPTNGLRIKKLQQTLLHEDLTSYPHYNLLQTTPPCSVVGLFTF